MSDDLGRLRAQWDQLDAWITELEERGEQWPNCRLMLAEAEALLDHADALEDILNEYA